MTTETKLELRGVLVLLVAGILIFIATVALVDWWESRQPPAETFGGIPLCDGALINHPEGLAVDGAGFLLRYEKSDKCFGWTLYVPPKAQTHGANSPIITGSGNVVEYK